MKQVDLEHRVHELVMAMLVNGDDVEKVAPYVMEAMEYRYYINHVKPILEQVN